MSKRDEKAPEGEVWVCAACGKTAQWRWPWGKGDVASAGWDESCSLHAVLVSVTDIADPPDWKPYGRVRTVR